jgi:CRP/FNR family transcriptional regulator
MDAQPQFWCHSKNTSRNCDNCVARHISICSSVDEKNLEQLQSISSDIRISSGKIIIDQGQPLKSIYIILDGMVKLYQLLPDGRRQITGFLGPGDILGGIKKHSHSHCFAETVTDVKACAFDRASFLGLLEQNPNLILRLLVAATDEIEAQHGHITLLGRQRTAERLAAFLLLCSKRWVGRDGDHTKVPLPMSRADIADHLGQTIESVSRGLRRLERRGYIELPRPSMVILKNIPALCHLAGFEEVPTHEISLGI